MSGLTQINRKIYVLNYFKKVQIYLIISFGIGLITCRIFAPFVPRSILHSLSSSLRDFFYHEFFTFLLMAILNCLILLLMFKTLFKRNFIRMALELVPIFGSLLLLVRGLQIFFNLREGHYMHSSVMTNSIAAVFLILLVFILFLKKEQALKKSTYLAAQILD